MNVDLELLYEKLIEGFAERELQILTPGFRTDRRAAAKTRYQNDPLFHARVNAVTSAVIDVVQDCEVNA